ncbi:hypothetical protein D3C76_1133910 [compost metagenome]
MVVWVMVCSGMSVTLVANPSISSMKAPRALAARPFRALAASSWHMASHIDTWLWRACSRMASTVFSPMPRGGTLITRSRAASLPRPSISRR